MNDTVNSFFKAFDLSHLADEWTLNSIGVKNINFYRSKFKQLTIKLSAPVRFAVMDICRHQKNLEKFNSGKKMYSDKWPSEVKLAAAWIANSCVKTTKESDTNENKMCMLKIPSSFPEVCSVLAAIKCPENSKSLIILETMWAASLNFAEDARVLNKEYEKSVWESYEDKKNKGSKLKFDEAIYNQSAQDKIPLVMLDGSIFKEGGPYTCDNLDEYIIKIKNTFGSKIIKGPENKDDRVAAAGGEVEDRDDGGVGGEGGVEDLGVEELAKKEADAEAELLAKEKEDAEALKTERK